MKIMKLLSSILCVVILISTIMLNAQNEPAEPSKSKDLAITILVHGIISVKPYLNISNVIKFIQDKIANTTYARSIEQTRRDPYFYQHHPMQKLGLKKINLTNNQPGAAATAYAQLFDKLKKHPNKQTEHQYYTFGWSGLLSPRMRYLEAKILYDQMLKEFEPYFNENYNLTFNIIGYSHGANLALKLAEVYKKEGYEKNKKLIINKLILIGAPILPETDYLINSSLFKRVYHFYSYGDRIQRLDFFSLNRVFSNRKFHDRCDFAIPDKLVQINVKVKRAAYTKKASCQNNVSYLIHHRSSLRNADPGHTELWSFGWSPSSYRQSFPLNPLPLAVFTPYIIEQLNEAMPDAKNLMVELHPDYEHMLFYDFEVKYEKIVPFITTSQLAQLKKHVETFRPDNNNFNRYKYNKKVNKTITQARKEQIINGKNKKLARRTKYSHDYRTRSHNNKKSFIASC